MYRNEILYIYYYTTHILWKKLDFYYYLKSQFLRNNLVIYLPTSTSTINC